ncbi:MAG TPA: hypothetical protein DDW24_06650 [Blastocatellia bacterium]|nr:hypothetical protein [Blastocatellia bacterium]
MKFSYQLLSYFAAITAAAVFGLSAESAAAQNATSPIAGTTSQARAEFKRLLDLQAALKKITMNRQDREPHRSFLKKNEKNIVYSEPSAEYYVQSRLFWSLSEKYNHLPIADEIAWAAARNPLPGECEGYLNCYLYVIRTTDIEYLSRYPNGKYSKQALRELISGLESTVADLGKNEMHTGPAEASERAELAKMLGEMLTIVSKVPHPEASQLLSQLKRIGETYRQ